MEKARTIARIIEPEQVIEGAGVRLRRSIGTRTLNYLDPFLLLDHFASRDRADYEAGFPMHPHRGIETVTYLLEGAVRHKDTVGNSGEIGAGDVQWMTAAGGIMHEEMPQVRPEGIDGFQLWVNLPAKLKMTRPRYQGIDASEIPEIEVEGGVKLKLIAGTANGSSGPVAGIAADPIYLDVSIPAGSHFIHPVPRDHNAFAYVFRGAGAFGGSNKQPGQPVSHTRLLVLSDGDHLEVVTADSPVRFLLIAAKPLGEPIARYGPFVMNTRQEIEQALADLRNGTFVWNDKI
ncbi:MAG TPA: pirin family protein [Blastocatellia bacterium]|nr:pirin family protein [Blastocatellia bacterium]